jgi:hypothetical protein
MHHRSFGDGSIHAGQPIGMSSAAVIGPADILQIANNKKTSKKIGVNKCLLNPIFSNPY